MTVYKLFRVRGGSLFPLYVEWKREMPVGVWIEAHVGELIDEGHVRSRTGGNKGLSLRPGFHSTLVPFTDWIGKKGPDGRLYQSPDTVWCECEVEGKEEHPPGRNGKKTLPSDWYFFKTNARQKDPWIISNRIKINRVLSHDEVAEICHRHGIEPQALES